MSAGVNNLSSRMAGRLRCALWVALLIGHAPALIRRAAELVGGSADSFNPAPLLALALICTFFFLKAVDVRCLRFHTDRRSLLTLTAAACLMHWNVLPHGSDATFENAEHLVICQALMGSSLVSTRRLTSRLLRGLKGYWPSGLIRPVRPIAILVVESSCALARLPASPHAPRPPPVLL